MAEVVCSGTISIDSVSVTPIRPGSSSSNTAACAERSGQAGTRSRTGTPGTPGRRSRRRRPGDPPRSPARGASLVPVLRQGVGDLDPEGVEHQVVVIPVGGEKLPRRPGHLLPDGRHEEAGDVPSLFPGPESSPRCTGAAVLLPGEGEGPRAPVVLHHERVPVREGPEPAVDHLRVEETFPECRAASAPRTSDGPSPAPVPRMPRRSSFPAGTPTGRGRAPAR